MGKKGPKDHEFYNPANQALIKANQMIRKLPIGKHVYDICIIGAGPAGMTIAAELAHSGKKICVLESGGQKRTVFANALKEVVSEALPIRPDSRERVVGGSSSTWGGLSALLDAIDFSPRPWNEGWPIKRHDLDPYLAAAEKYRFPSPEAFDPASYPSGGWPSLKNLEDKIFVAIRPQYHFGVLKSIFERDCVDLYIETTVTELGTSGENVSHAVCKSPDGGVAIIQAGLFVLAAGGIENPRILLNSRLGNEYDQVGRYFMNHPKGYAGFLRLSHPLLAKNYYLPRNINGFTVYAGLRLSEAFQRERGLLNGCMQLEPNAGLFQRYVFAIWRRLPDLCERMLVIMRPRTLRVRWFAEMESRPENRVILGQKRDSLGSPIPIVRYELGERDRATITALHAQLKENVERLKLGKLSGTAEEAIESVRNDASHHLGGTRMGLDSRNSVVDPDCKVHTVSNLYVAGGSVFPTSGCANPTMTIVALAIRLAEHIRQMFSIDTDVENDVMNKAGDNIVIIGAGKRVSADILPALESLPDKFIVKDIYARHRAAVFGNRKRYDVFPISSLSKERLQGVRFIYLAVPPRSVAQVLKGLPPADKNAELIIDTPVSLPLGIWRILPEHYRRVHVAEDSVFLPWIPLAKRMGRIKRIDCMQSVYRYHGIALVKALTSNTIRYGWRWGNRIWLHAGKTLVRIVEPRDYEHGKLFIDGKEVELLREGNQCAGFRLGGKSERLSPEESRLAGYVEKGDTIISKMAELKRVGLRRLLAAASIGEETWGIEEGRSDARTDRFLHRYRVYISL